MCLSVWSILLLSRCLNFADQDFFLNFDQSLFIAEKIFAEKILNFSTIFLESELYHSLLFSLGYTRVNTIFLLLFIFNMTLRYRIIWEMNSCCILLKGIFMSPNWYIHEYPLPILLPSTHVAYFVHDISLSFVSLQIHI